MKLDPEIVKKVIEYREDGRLFWKTAPKDVFPTEAKFSQFYLHKTWNSKHAGKEALIFTDNHGYRMGMIFGVRVKAHQVVWLLHNGDWPKHQIDHINGNPSDNRIENLRDVPHEENVKNMRLRKDNKSGFVGVHPLPTGKFCVQITYDRKTRHVGVFDTFEEAKAARIKAQEKAGFAKRHGSPNPI